MLKIDQKNIRVFHIVNDGTNSTDEELKQFIAKSLPILQGYLLVFDYLSDDLRAYLDAINIDYIKPNSLKFTSPKAANPIQSKKIVIDSTSIQNNQKTQDSAKDTTNYATKVLQKVVRSGESIKNDGDIVILNRVNSAATIRSNNNICIFGQCDGDVECNGDFMILSSITKGKIVFNGESITANMLKYTLNLIIKENGVLNIKDILSI